ncbi:MAG: hypothetical protein HY421_02175 [Candidatus Kerfeldbacteria bacterium]|nr:hypothetical protein [Candidatus Kerfeldbacteria bacterium]
MTQTITIRTYDRVYRVGNVNRIGSVKQFVTKKAGGRPHGYIVVSITTGRGTVEEHWRLEQCRPAD